MTIATDEDYAVTIVSGSSEFKIMGQSGEDFPTLPEVEQERLYSMEQAKLRDMIRQTIFSIAQDGSKPVLTGNYLSCGAIPFMWFLWTAIAFPSVKTAF